MMKSMELNYNEGYILNECGDFYIVCSSMGLSMYAHG